MSIVVTHVNQAVCPAFTAPPASCAFESQPRVKPGVQTHGLPQALYVARYGKHELVHRAGVVTELKYVISTWHVHLCREIGCMAIWRVYGATWRVCMKGSDLAAPWPSAATRRCTLIGKAEFCIMRVPDCAFALCIVVHKM